MKLFGSDDYEPLLKEARVSPRRRKMRNLHHQQDYVQRMFNAVNSDAYFRPHKHINPDKSETMLVLRGDVGVLEFNDDGAVVQAARLRAGQQNICVDFDRRVWHTIVVFEDDSLIFEAKEGPYDPETDKVFAPWAPEEDSSETGAYLESLKEEVLNSAG